MWTAAHGKRLTYLIHRWTGVGGCILMTLWVVSGVVMLFVGYPKLLPEERMRPLPVLVAPACCVPAEQALAHSQAPAAVQQITLTSVGGNPVYLLREQTGVLLAIDASTGRRMPAVDEARALGSARSFLPGATGQVLGRVQDDRWTHSGALNPHRPLFKVQMNDPRSTLLYVSSSTGEVVMDAPAAQRSWNYLGAWLHWLYMFRDGSRDPVWSWTVIILSAVCTLSAITGAFAGVWRWRFSGRYKSGAKTPYREFQMHWHHLIGLVFGAILITWIFSGLMSMNPVGIFDPSGERPDLQAYQQGVPGEIRPSIDTRSSLGLLKSANFTPRELEWRALGGEAFLLARSGPEGTRLVVPGGSGHVVLDRWPADRLSQAAQRLMQSGVESTLSLSAYDAYYFRRQEASMYAAAERRLPVLRVDYGDAGRTTAYLDVYTGDVALSVDSAQRTGRWLFNLLHSWDLPVFLNHASTREVLLTFLSVGAVLITVTGTVIGWRRLKTFCSQRWRSMRPWGARRIESPRRV